jgi:uncharacterized protein (UPF0276 family)
MVEASSPRASTKPMGHAAPRCSRRPPPTPAHPGIGLRAQHYRTVLEQRPAVAWFEVHAENYFGDGGRPLHYLEQVRADYPLSLHGVGLSLGSTDPLNERHLDKLKGLISRYEPTFISEHLSWSSVANSYLNDLLPLPYTEDALKHVVTRIAQVQDYLGRQILIENISRYVDFTHSTIPEWDFVTEATTRSGCGILLDVNNIYVNAVNHGFDAYAYVRHIPGELVHEIHLAGFTRNRFEDGEIIIDSHNRRVADAVWALFRYATDRFGLRPTLIEWDTDLPALSVLIEEAQKANAIMETSDVRVA